MFRTKFDKEAKLWRGRDVPLLYDSNTSIAQVLLEKMKLNGSRIAQISADSGKSLTYDELRLNTIRAAQNLQKRGYDGSKQVFAFLAKNSDYLTSLMFASFCLGSMADMWNASHGKTDIIPLLQMTRPNLFFCDVELYDVLLECLNEVSHQATIFTFNGVKGESEAVENLFEETGTEENFIPVEVDGFNDAAIKMASSGTSGPSKGVLLSHATLICNTVTFDAIEPDDVLLNMNAIDWITSLVAVLLAAYNGATLLITKQPFSPEFQLGLFEKYKVTFLISPPFHMILNLKSGLMSKTNLASIRLQFIGGGKVPFDTLNEYNSYLSNGSAVVTYGLSEMGSCVTVDWPKSGKDTIGQLVGGFCMKIIDENGNQCGVEMDGEIRIKNATQFIGYFGCEQQTKDAIDDEGFFITGDIGHVDEDGNIFIVDREKDLLKYCSRKFSPSDVESFLIRSTEIEAACVTGIPDDLAGDLPAAVVVRTANSQICGDKIFQLVADRFPDNYKLRGGVYFVNEIPKTSSGKQIRRKVREIAIEQFKTHELCQCE